MWSCVGTSVSVVPRKPQTVDSTSHDAAITRCYSFCIGIVHSYSECLCSHYSASSFSLGSASRAQTRHLTPAQCVNGLPTYIHIESIFCTQQLLNCGNFFHIFKSPSPTTYARSENNSQLRFVCSLLWLIERHVGSVGAGVWTCALQLVGRSAQACALTPQGPQGCQTRGRWTRVAAASGTARAGHRTTFNNMTVSTCYLTAGLYSTVKVWSLLHNNNFLQDT